MADFPTSIQFNKRVQLKKCMQVENIVERTSN